MYIFGLQLRISARNVQGVGVVIYGLQLTDGRLSEASLIGQIEALGRGKIIIESDIWQQDVKAPKNVGI